jgi:hypothetical protein
VAYLDERHRAVAADVENWLSADGIDFGTDNGHEPTAFFITESRGAVSVTAVEGSIAIGLRWSLVQPAPDDVDLYRQALTSNGGLVAGRIVLDESGLWFSDVLPAPATQQEFRYRLARAIRDVARLRDELATRQVPGEPAGRRPSTGAAGAGLAHAGLANAERDSVLDWATGFADRRPDDGRLLPQITAELGPIPETTPAARRRAEEFFQARLDWAVTRSERAAKVSGRVDHGLSSRAEYWRAVLAWFRSSGQPATGQPATGQPASGFAPHLDGVYVAAGPAQAAYLRFHEGGTVTHLSGEATPQDAAERLSPGQPGVSEGRFALRGVRIRFTLDGSGGRVSYSGRFSDDATRIELEIHRHASGSRSQESYGFVRVGDAAPVDVPRPEPPVAPVAPAASATRSAAPAPRSPARVDDRLSPKDRSAAMILAWIRAMEEAQPQYGPLLQSTVDKVGYPAIDSGGVIRTIREDLAYWGAAGYMRGFAGSRVQNMMYQALGAEYPELKAAGDEEGMVLALKKGEFYETLHGWITSHDPQKLPMKEIPDWLRPFVVGAD